MYEITVIYNHPADPAAFDDYYWNTHVALARKIPGLQSASFVKCDTLDGSTPSHYGIARLVFDSKDQALAGLGSPEGQVTSADVANFASGGATLLFAGDPDKI
ncbi:MAG TPA: EthD family reductase [Gordonia sp. (in: high G+C Gram-positive bacteria)]|uniref:EthD family reductase n=1 Tax=unclassified Gordonia (in: high G+C Gram-positive bacteria) TaxID=2657482 RepID=UPI000FAEFB31|nr:MULTISPECIES: EthD family reductase [unclassified Gordonia (in: high G+C Gram-positive bacteria)]RUP40030.1 MAG: EthD family reductase [Gordonia sp. (in: high G+C Gram-positive bacteria)]HNP56603.1 EthD family reductase [Gordonia sp. (in: high G+C Gram-positive bacteria)]HRC49692.1 EthD family reductase [Gordonia sp. (in: high G+C Gram-positive bacteria)]